MRPSARVKYPVQDRASEYIYDMTEPETNLLADRTWTTSGDVVATKTEYLRRRKKFPGSQTADGLFLKKGLNL